MAKRIDAAQIRLAKELRESGESWPAIAKATGASERGLRYHAEKGDWLNKGNKPKPAGKLAGKPANGIEPMGQSEIERIAEVVKSRLAKVISWRAISISITMIVIWFFTGDIRAATSLTFFLHILLTIANYIF